jgi:hypothetical protein
MSRTIVVTLLISLIACGVGPRGPEGPEGPKGGGLYASKDDVYCREASFPGTLIATARCDAPEDLGLTGSCTDGANGAILANSEPVHWSNDGSLLSAQWQCEWSGPPGAEGGTARICCIKNAE